MGAGMALHDVAEDYDVESERGSMTLQAQPADDSESSEDENRIQRDGLVNPYWIEDRDLKNGPIDFLPGVEIQFWKDLIEKYQKDPSFKQEINVKK